MIPTLDKIGSFVYLVMVDPKNNNNKWYKIEKINDTEILCTYGRIQESAQQNKTYFLSKYESIYRQKIKKGYTDNTYLLIEDSVKDKSISIHTDKPEVNEFLNFINTNTRKVVQSALSVDINSVTEKQVDESKNVMLDISSAIINKDIDDANNLLVKQFTIIPRFIPRSGFASFIFSESDEEKNKLLLEKEYELLDQLSTIISNKDKTTNSKSNNIFELEYLNTKFLANKYTNGLVSDYKDSKVKKIYRVHHSVTRNYELENSRLLWHGSRNENWLSILTNGLQVRPPGIPTTGSMFGNGLYFAELSQKSVGYTSYKGSYWTRGSDNSAVLALYNVGLGREKINESGRTMYIEDVVKQGYDSLHCYGKQKNKNSRLWNDEIIIPKSTQCNIAYLFWIGA